MRLTPEEMKAAHEKAAALKLLRERPQDYPILAKMAQPNWYPDLAAVLEHCERLQRYDELALTIVRSLYPGDWPRGGRVTALVESIKALEASRLEWAKLYTDQRERYLAAQEAAHRLTVELAQAREEARQKQDDVDHLCNQLEESRDERDGAKDEVERLQKIIDGMREAERLQKIINLMRSEKVAAKEVPK